jgi:hypothetical protein
VRIKPSTLSFETFNARAQRSLIEFAQELGKDDLHVQMPDAVKRSGWRYQLKDDNNVRKRLMVGQEGAERDANQREKAASKEVNAKATEAEEAEEDIEEEAVEDPFLPPPSTAPAAIQTSRAGRKWGRQ